MAEKITNLLDYNVVVGHFPRNCFSRGTSRPRMLLTSSQAGAHFESCVGGRRGPEGSIDLERRKDSENSEARTSCTSIFLSLPEPIVKHTGEPGCPTIRVRRCATLSPDASAPLTRRMVSPTLIRPSQSAGPCRTTCSLAGLSKDRKVVKQDVSHVQARALSLPLLAIKASNAYLVH
jgi:hypothetical protein